MLRCDARSCVARGAHTGSRCASPSASASVSFTAWFSFTRTIAMSIAIRAEPTPSRSTRTRVCSFAAARRHQVERRDLVGDHPELTLQQADERRQRPAGSAPNGERGRMRFLDGDRVGLDESMDALQHRRRVLQRLHLLRRRRRRAWDLLPWEDRDRVVTCALHQRRVSPAIGSRRSASRPMPAANVARAVCALISRAPGAGSGAARVPPSPAACRRAAPRPP